MTLHVETGLQVLNPVAQQHTEKISPAPRLARLEGQVIGLYWNNKAGGDAALSRVRELLSARYPGVETRSYIGSTGASTRFMTKEDVELIGRECSAVIASTAD